MISVQHGLLFLQLLLRLHVPSLLLHQCSMRQVFTSFEGFIFLFSFSWFLRYGSLAMGFNKGLVAAASTTIYRDGTGCGGCFHIWCKDTRLCNHKGVCVVVTDLTKANHTDCVLSGHAFIHMAKEGQATNLAKLRIVDIVYKWVPCVYKDKNLAIRVEESSQKPSNLTIKFLYQGGQTDILGVDVALLGQSNWQYMSHTYGAVWTTSQAPAGPLQFRMAVLGGYDAKWVYAEKEVLPADWKAGSN